MEKPRCQRHASAHPIFHHNVKSARTGLLFDFFCVVYALGWEAERDGGEKRRRVIEKEGKQKIRAGDAKKVAVIDMKILSNIRVKYGGNVSHLICVKYIISAKRGAKYSHISYSAVSTTAVFMYSINHRV